jgi:hypothetical protein
MLLVLTRVALNVELVTSRSQRNRRWHRRICRRTRRHYQWSPSNSVERTLLPSPVLLRTEWSVRSIPT